MVEEGRFLRLDMGAPQHLRRAGSMMSGRFVAATRNTPARPSAPSISVSSWFTTLRPCMLTCYAGCSHCTYNIKAPATVCSYDIYHAL